MRKYFGTDGIRGRVGEGFFTPEFVLKLGWAAGRVLGNGRGTVLIGKDTRVSGYMFESALEAGLVAAGVNIRLLGPMTTPGVAYLTRAFRASAGIVITASHNLYQDNGIKFFSPAGDKLPDASELAIETELVQSFQTVAASQLGKAQRVTDANGRYIEFCKGTIPASLDLRGLRIVVDCANGATYTSAPLVFEELGAQVIRLGTNPDGFNINDKLGSTTPETFCQTVRATKADLGIAFDGDGDRVLMADSQGILIDGDQLLYLIAKSRQQQGTLRGAIVGTVMSNLGLQHALQRLGLEFIRTKVGDRYIMEELKRTDGILGGEPSGHIICRDRTTTGDGIIAALQGLAALQQLKLNLAELHNEVARYPQALINVDLTHPCELKDFPKIQDEIIKIEKSLAGRGRVLLRPSGTEPVMRVMVEGEDARQVQQLAEQIATMVRDQIPEA